jgi:hypothetical protein
VGGKRYNICKKENMKKGLHIALTITGCKRPELFKNTIESLCDKIRDIHLIDTIIHYDDSSDEDSRKYMRDILYSNFPDKLICFRYFNKESFKSEKRHMCVMNHWLEDLNRLGVDYVLHTEDDWLYINDFSIADAILILSRDEQCGQVGLSQPIRKFPDDVNVELMGDYWKWYYSPDLPLLHNLFMDDTIIEMSNIPGFWCYFINWPHFSLRPGVFSVDRITSVGNFSSDGDSFELNFAIEYANKFHNYLHKSPICLHIGDSNSSYDLNDSKR